MRSHISRSFSKLRIQSNRSHTHSLPTTPSPFTHTLSPYRAPITLDPRQRYVFLSPALREGGEEGEEGRKCVSDERGIAQVFADDLWVCVRNEICLLSHRNDIEDYFTLSLSLFPSHSSVSVSHLHFSPLLSFLIFFLSLSLNLLSLSALWVALNQRLRPFLLIDGP